MERYEAAMRVTLSQEEEHCAWTVAMYEEAEREEAAERKRAGAALKRALRRDAKATARQEREEAERKRVELVAEIKREARDEVRVMRGLRWAERMEARRLSLAAYRNPERRRGGCRRSGVKTKKPSSSSTSSTSNSLSSICNDVSYVYDLLLPVMSGMYADVVPASVFCDVVSMIRSKRKIFVEAVSSSIEPPILLVVSASCLVHKHKLRVWRAGACHIDSMCRLGYG